MAEAFSQAWAEAWCDALNASETYRTAAAEWEGSVALVVREDGAGRAVFLDLLRGECRGARTATAEDLAAATYVIEADEATWQTLLDGRGSPVLALMTGKLQLTRGSLAALLPYVNAAKELVTTAVAVETSFPERES